MKLTIQQAFDGVEDAQAKLSDRQAISSPVIISENLYRLGQYAAALEEFLGDAELEYEKNWAKRYTNHVSGSVKYIKDPNFVPSGEPDSDTIDTVVTKPLSATAAKQQADVDMAEDKGNIKRLQRYVSAAWHVHMSCMARVKHLEAENKGSF